MGMVVCTRWSSQSGRPLVIPCVRLHNLACGVETPLCPAAATGNASSAQQHLLGSTLRQPASHLVPLHDT